MIDRIFGDGYFEMFVFLSVVVIIYLLVDIQVRVKKITKSLNKIRKKESQ